MFSFNLHRAKNRNSFKYRRRMFWYRLIYMNHDNEIARFWDMVGVVVAAIFGFVFVFILPHFFH